VGVSRKRNQKIKGERLTVAGRGSGSDGSPVQSPQKHKTTQSNSSSTGRMANTSPPNSFSTSWMMFLDNTNLTVISLTACCVLYTRSAAVAYFSAGAVVCSLTVKAIKKLLRHPRPPHRTQRKKSYGMPSTHSAAITYFAVYIPLACMFLPIHPSLPTGSAIRLLPPLIVLPWAASVVHSRIWMGHHTWPQAAVGCAYGAAFAVLWFSLWTNGANRLGEVVESRFNSFLHVH